MQGQSSRHGPGPLGLNAGGFRHELKRLGYTSLSAIVHMRLSYPRYSAT